MGRFPRWFVSLPLPQWGDSTSSGLCLCPSHNGEIPPVVCISAPPTMRRFPQ
ncbi:unnamed protein product [Staurois parvus]|uniref:Uncharacterized protein n=1 Tax=Staurois parvus TaxID=386267 RepID=A0ABN9AF93_9NEOB|nr:unnamed protein product [Staurois parvus]